jgi:hypothetical protein
MPRGIAADEQPRRPVRRESRVLNPLDPRSGGFQGLAFAIPIDVAMRIKDQIVILTNLPSPTASNASTAASWRTSAPSLAAGATPPRSPAQADPYAKPDNTIIELKGIPYNSPSAVMLRDFWELMKKVPED